MGLVRWRTPFPAHRTTVADKKAYKYTYLLKGLDIDRRNQVWELDISYIPMRRGYMYLFAIIDLYTRYVVGWSLSNTMTAQWCVAVLREAFERHGCPEIVNSDQGSQFTSADYVELLEGNGVAISMDSRGRALDDFGGVMAPICCCSDWLNQMGLNIVISVQTHMMPPSRLSLDYSS